jgi:predicted metal-dependent hydrolase
LTPLLPTYTHIVNPKLKNIYLTFDHEGGLIIKSPRVSQREIEKVLIKKASWISRSRQKILEKKGKPLNFEEGEEIYFLGSPYPLRLRHITGDEVQLTFDEENGFTLAFSEYDADLFQSLLERFYKNNALHYIPPIVEKHSQKMQLFPKKISFRKAKKRWGSCSNNNAISFNYLMMKLPPEVVRYIVVHELAHIQHKHHQKSFWKLVADTMPDYRQYEKELKNYM